MKLTKISKLVKQSGECRIFWDEGQQWIGSDRAVYAVENALIINQENALAVLDVERDKRDSIYVQSFTVTDELGGLFSVEPQNRLDEQLKEDIRVMYKGNEVVILHGMETGARIGVYADELDMVGKKSLAFLRMGRVVVFPDMLCAAIIRGIDEEVVEEIDNMMRAALVPDV